MTGDLYLCKYYWRNWTHEKRVELYTRTLQRSKMSTRQGEALQEHFANHVPSTTAIECFRQAFLVSDRAYSQSYGLSFGYDALQSLGSKLHSSDNALKTQFFRELRAAEYPRAIRDLAERMLRY